MSWTSGKLFFPLGQIGRTRKSCFSTSAEHFYFCGSFQSHLIDNPISLWVLLLQTLSSTQPPSFSREPSFLKIWRVLSDQVLSEKNLIALLHSIWLQVRAYSHHPFTSACGPKSPVQTLGPVLSISVLPLFTTAHVFFPPRKLNK